MSEMTTALLRPEFTRKLVIRLQGGASINLTARHGLGRRRTLQDLRSLLLRGMRVLYADMKFCLNDFPATMGELCAQAGLGNIIMQNLGELIDVLPENDGGYLFILHNFDLLKNTSHDPRFDTGLLPYLSRIAAKRGLALLIVCEAIYPDWELPCEALALPLGDEDIIRPESDAQG